ncbi:MAG TPA: glycosyltransferase [Bacteroidetes bacterium]|nr:glycosyltransferase [Bacteroidota bacterium]
MDISLVVPIYNEELLINSLLDETTSSLNKISEDFEIICVDDGSRDSSLEKILAYRKKDSRVKVVILSRNFGHQAAYTAGLSYAKGNFIGMMDGDLQDPPALFSKMYDMLQTKNFDVVFGHREARKEKFMKRMLILLFHKIFSRLSNINAPADVGNFSMMTRGALKAFLSLQEKNRYLPGLRYFIGFRQGFVEYKRSDREIGEAKMNFTKLFKLALDAIFSFSKIPIRLCWIIGLIGILFSIGGSAVVLYKKMTGDAISGWTSVLTSMYFLGSVQLFFLGIIGEYIHRIFVETQNRPIFIVREFVD